MNDFLLVYFQFNLLLVIFYVLWTAINSINMASKNSVPFHTQLKIARSILVFLLLTTLLSPQIKYFFPNTIITEFPIQVVNISPAHSTQFYSVGVTDILLLGFMIQLIRFSRCFLSLYRIIKNATPWRRVGNIKVLFSEKTSTPFSTRAFFQNHIILPYSLLNSSEYLQIVIRHEVQHHRNGDLNWVLLLEALKLFCFWNPAAYLWKNQLDCLQEYACDEALLISRKTSSVQYSLCLLDIATCQDRSTLIACSNMVPNFSFLKKSDSQLKRRLTMLNTISTNRKSPFKTFAQVALLSLGVVTSSVFVFAQGEENRGISINGVFISEQEILPYKDLAEIPEPYKSGYIEAMELAYEQLVKEDNESSETHTMRIVREYMNSKRAIRELKDYATGYEAAYDNLEREKESLEAKIATLELENARLLNEN